MRVRVTAAHYSQRVSVEQNHVAALLARRVREPAVFGGGRERTDAARVARLLAHNGEQLQVTKVDDVQ